MNKICDLFEFKQRKSSMYHAAANGLAEAFNKTLCNLLKKVVSKSKRDWHERTEEALWAIGQHIDHLFNGFKYKLFKYFLKYLTLNYWI